MGRGAASGGNLKMALAGQSPGWSEGPAPDMAMFVCARRRGRAACGELKSVLLSVAPAG